MTHVALRDPVDGSTFRSIACAAPLLRTLSEEHRITIREIYLMIRLELFGLPGLNEDWDPDCELENRTIDARRDARRLRELREEGGGTLEELVAILERSRDGLKWLARFDPSRAKEVAAALEASEQRIRKTICDHISSVRKESARSLRMGSLAMRQG